MDPTPSPSNWQLIQNDASNPDQLINLWDQTDSNMRLSPEEMEEAKAIIPTDGQFSSDGEFTQIANHEITQLGGNSEVPLDSIKVENSFHQGQGQQYYSSPYDSTVQHNEATSKTPSNVNWPGPNDFSIRILPPSKSKDAQFSSKMSKLYINQNRIVQIFFKVRPSESVPIVEEGLFIRAVPVFTRPDEFQEVVKVCSQHSNPGDKLSHHLIKCTSNENIIYLEDPTSSRLSVMTALPKLQAGTNEVALYYKFTDLGSCPGGLNRRETAVIFTLEHWGEIIGRQVLPIRICTCPKRDMGNEEKQDRTGVNGSGPTGHNQPNEGKVRMDKSDTKEYWVLARGDKNYEALKKMGEVLDQATHGTAFNYKETVNHFNHAKKGTKRRRIQETAPAEHLKEPEKAKPLPSFNSNVHADY